MRNIFRNFINVYLAIGGLLGTILWASYLWPFTWGASQYVPQMGFIQRTVAIAVVQPYAVFSSIVRSFFWGPSLIVWALGDNLGYSFAKWLAPGLYMERLEMERGSKTFLDRSASVKCFKKNSLEKYIVLSIVDAEMVMCSGILPEVQQEKQIWINAELSNFENDAEEECSQLRSKISQLALKKVTIAFKKDGEQVFCRWVAEAMDKRNDELWQRFLDKH